jgi:hypothetical protein
VQQIKPKEVRYIFLGKNPHTKFGELKPLLANVLSIHVEECPYLRRD